jgi:nucleoside-diphosphate-sugar epimerase
MRFTSTVELEAALSSPPQAVIDTLRDVPGDIIVLGVGGKMGPTLARMAKRAAPDRRVIGVARFSESGLSTALESYGVECIACDLLDRDAIARLPDVSNVIFMAGRKFGSKGQEDLTWAMNAYVPALVAERYLHSRIVVFSTACVYPYSSPESGGASETTPTVPPPGDYANSCVARERMFQYFSRLRGTPGRLLRVSYAIDMRYGVVHDIARKIVTGVPIDLTMGYVNVIWQGDANAQALRTLAHCTRATTGLNISGPMQSVRDLAVGLGQRLGKAPNFSGQPAGDAWLVNCEEATRIFGPPTVGIEQLLDWSAAWVADGLPSLAKETHFETRDGNY